jgi:hypothetical protein
MQENSTLRIDVTDYASEPRTEPFKKVCEANGVSMDAEMQQMMEKAGMQRTGS